MGPQNPRCGVEQALGAVRVLIMDHQAERYRRAVLERFPDIIVDAAIDKAAAMSLAPEAQVIAALAPRMDADLLRSAGKLQWIQALTTGTDTIERLECLSTEVLLTSARGIHGPQMSEMAFLHMLSLVRRADEMVRNRDRQLWRQWPQGLLYDKTITIVGLGAIASDLALRCKAFAMRVTGVSKVMRQVEHFDRVYSRDALTEAVADADFVILLLPYDAASHNLVNGDVLAAMKPSAFLINLARGGVLDEAALLAALEHGAIAGAGLDVFASEPLPPESPLWTAPNLMVTPHLGGASDVYVEQVAPILVKNLGFFLEGRRDQMVNRVR